MNYGVILWGHASESKDVHNLHKSAVCVMTSSEWKHGALQACVPQIGNPDSVWLVNLSLISLANIGENMDSFTEEMSTLITSEEGMGLTFHTAVPLKLWMVILSQP